MTPLVSVIVPCYNQARFLPETLESVVSQSFQDWECVIINDGSTDNTIDVAQTYSSRDPRFRLVTKPNGGLSSARNRGLLEAKGKWIQFLDSDDILLPEKLEKQVTLLDLAKKPALSFCDYYFCSENDIHQRVSKGKKFEHPRLLMSSPIMDLASRWESELSIPVHCFLFDSSIFFDNKITFDEDIPNHEDWDCWMRIFSLNPTIIPIEEELAIYRQHRSSMTANKPAMWLGYEKALKKQLNLHKNSPQLRLAITKTLNHMHYVYTGHPRTPLAKLAHGYRYLSAKVQRDLFRLYHKMTPWPVQKFVKSLRQTSNK